MKEIIVSASKEYPIIIGHDLYDDIGSYISKVTHADKIAVISESNVFPIYGDKIVDKLQQAGYSVCSYVFPAGESSKNGTVFLSILEFLAQNNLTRSDCVIALGGGVVGDITGFAAATFLRGIAYIQVPTTLLAMVDSSVGGKTAIDLSCGKNLAGAFYQPNLVLCDLNTLQSLPDDIFIDGCAEVIKYGILFDAELFAHLSENGLNFDREYVISRCIELKRNVVQTDEFDRGLRQMLNLGHTIGHAVEAKSEFTLSHGKAVAIGMAIVARAANSNHICTSDVTDKIIDIIKRFRLPVTTQYDAITLYDIALSDKKRAGQTVNLIIPEEIGRCIIFPTAINTLESFIEAGL